jgi:hypothetical protein
MSNRTPTIAMALAHRRLSPSSQAIALPYWHHVRTLDGSEKALSSTGYDNLAYRVHKPIYHRNTDYSPVVAMPAVLSRRES